MFDLTISTIKNHNIKIFVAKGITIKSETLNHRDNENPYVLTNKYNSYK